MCGLPAFTPLIQKSILERLIDIRVILSPPSQLREPPANRIVSHTDWTPVKKLGQGAFAVVNLCRINAAGRNIAVKELKTVQLNTLMP
jgi:hypothetical protein